MLPVLTQHIVGLACNKICGDEESTWTVELGDGVSMTYGSDGQKHIVTARKRVRIYAERKQEGGREKAEKLA